MTPLEVMHGYITHMRAGRFDEGFRYFADDIVGHVPGRSSLSGEKHGRDEVAGYIQAVLDRAPGEVRVELLDTLVGEQYVGLLVREQIGGANPFELIRLNIYRVRDDKICEIRIFEGDQYAADAHLA